MSPASRHEWYLISRSKIRTIDACDRNKRCCFARSDYWKCWRHLRLWKYCELAMQRSLKCFGFAREDSSGMYAQCELYSMCCIPSSRQLRSSFWFWVENELFAVFEVSRVRFLVFTQHSEVLEEIFVISQRHEHFLISSSSRIWSLYMWDASGVCMEYITACCGCYRQKKTSECCCRYHPVHRQDVSDSRSILPILSICRSKTPASRVMRIKLWSQPSICLCL